jgi:hypothetical protein
MFKGIRDNIATRITPTRAHWSELRGEIAARFGQFRQDRDSGLQKALEEDFSLLLQAWGIENEAELPGILRDLRLRCLVLAMPIVAALVAVLLTPGFASTLTLALVALPCLFGFLATRWRISILQNRAFLPFHRWLARLIQPRSI